VIKAEYRDKANCRCGDIENVLQYHLVATGNAELNRAQASGVHMSPTDTGDGMQCNRMKGFEVRLNGGDVAHSTSVEDEGRLKQGISGSV